MAEINLSQGKVAIVDDNVYELVFCYRWHCSSKGYAQHNYREEGRTKPVKMHMFIWELVNGDIPEGMQIDHINGNRLDNRLCNLRIVSQRKNQQNRKCHREGRLPGTKKCKDNKTNPWSARIQVSGRQTHLGVFPTEQEAHERYLEELRKIGEQHV